MEYEIVVIGQNDYEFLKLEKIKLNATNTRTVSFPVPKSVKRNQSYTVDAVITPIENGRKLYDQSIKSSTEITKLIPPKPDSYQLLGNTPTADRKQPFIRPEMHLHNKIFVTTVPEPVIFDWQRIPPEIAPLLRVSRPSNGRLRYAPLVFLNRFLIKGSEVERVSTASSTNVSIELTVGPASLGQVRLWRLIERAADELSSLGLGEATVSAAASVFVNTSFELLILATTVAALHLLFDILAFKSDISFWRGAHTTEGISGATVVWRCVSSVIIFFFLLEEDSSILVLGPVFVGGLIECWKLCRVLGLSITTRGLQRRQKDVKETQTSELDAQGTRYLMWLMVPLCVAGAVYSLLRLPHKSWYSWTINTLANGVYVFGFLFMTPQLFINYKLKSVAHLPWKALTFKAFNTFIDDFFAFIIVMPTSHRLACFRDDIVFVIYIYQRWLYPVDKSRRNEYGESFDAPTGDSSIHQKSD